MTGPDDELKELGDTFDQLLGRLDASFLAQRQFVANASHELRTPLARQRTLLEVALRHRHASGPAVPGGGEHRSGHTAGPARQALPAVPAYGPGAQGARRTGAGLAIVSAVAAAHEAELRAVTRSAGGLAVEILFPVADLDRGELIPVTGLFTGAGAGTYPSFFATAFKNFFMFLLSSDPKISKFRQHGNRHEQ